MDVNAGRILDDDVPLDGIGCEIYNKLLSLARSRRSVSEELGHREFVLGYKYLEALEPSCLPAAGH